MTQQSHAAIAKAMLRTKDKIESKQKFALNAIQRVKDANPAMKMGPIQVLHELQNLKNASSSALRKTAVAGLAKALLSRPKTAAGRTCKKCGAVSPLKASFCLSCGSKLT